MSVVDKFNGDATPRKRKYEDDAAVPKRKLRRTSEDTSAASEDEDLEEGSAGVAKRHTKKERKQNRSTRIHSLRKQLARGTLPSNIQQEKERELAALLHEQGKTKSKQQAKRTLEKYHYVRFVERQKAEKRLRQLRKQLDKKEDENLRSKLHEMEVNRNYAIYAPLNQKYISIFVLHSGTASAGDDGAQTLSKPDMWYVVEKTMAQGQTALEALRDGKAGANVDTNQPDEELAGRQSKSSRISSRKVKVSKTGSKDTRLQKDRPGATLSDGAAEDMLEDDDSDGGFFER